ncbi:unnamed protein product [Dovyalis caffra]|uniref:Hexosyltransferase n=1 Tax=Dovyalis caffra TaxID=77055 RepID=A0AAV1RY38_9ROSI|nr:unnamed protein product [Dovyalis caffra]
MEIIWKLQYLQNGPLVVSVYSDTIARELECERSYCLRFNKKALRSRRKCLNSVYVTIVVALVEKFSGLGVIPRTLRLLDVQNERTMELSQETNLRGLSCWVKEGPFPGNGRPRLVVNGWIDDVRNISDEIAKPDVVTWNATIAGYAQNGMLEQATKMFLRMPVRNTNSWRAIMSGFVQNGNMKEGWILFAELHKTGMVPNHSSFSTTNTLANNTNPLVKQASISSCAYVTFLAGNGDYWKGVVGLAKGLRKAQSKYPLLVAILPDVPEEHRRILVSQGCIVREIEPVHPPENRDTHFAMAYYVINYSKLRIWEFVEYSKLIYLDGDIQVFDNIDHLFDMPDGYFYAARDCFCEKTWSNSPQYKIGYCQQCPDKVKWPAEMGPKPPLYFNAGMFVYEPNLSTYHDLLETLKVTPPTLFAEQDFLNMFFRDVYKPIPSDYNLVLALLWRHPENINLDKVKVVHYCAAGSKPWRYTGEEKNMDREDIKMLVQKWWDIYDDESLDYNNNVVAAAGGEMQPFLAALSEAGVLHYVTAPSAA